MLRVTRDPYPNEYEDRFLAETPFVDPRANESQEEPSREGPDREAFGGDYEVTSPFAFGEWSETGEMETAAPEIAALGELVAELKDSEFREALEQLADEALEMHADQLAGEYGDRETRDAAAERLLNEHFHPLAAQTEAMIDRFVERLEGYEANALTEMEIERIADEVIPVNQPLSPASEQFLGAFGRKLGKVASFVVKAPLKVAALTTKLALGPLFAPLKKAAKFLLGHVVKHAIHLLPMQYRPLSQKLSERLFHELGETHESEAEDHEQTEAEAIPASTDVARLEAEFDLQVAQLLLTPEETEADHLVSSYGEEFERGYESPMQALDRARAELAGGLSRLQPGESAQPVMEQFLPAVAAVWTALKTAIALAKRPNVVKFLGRILGKMISPLVGAEGAKLLGPPIASVGLRYFGLETGEAGANAVATEALAATIEETVTRLCELPPHVFEDETLLDSAVREAFEDAAATYFPPATIRPELRETADQHGMWRRMPEDSQRKRYAKYTEKPEVTITPRVAATVHTFHGNTLQDHLHDRMHIQQGQTVKTNVRLYQALPGTRASDIARREGIPPDHLHPLTQHAAAALLGKDAGLGPRAATPTQHSAHLARPHKLYLHQRLYYIEPPGNRQHVHQRHHVRLARSELLINLRSGEIRIWLFLSEPLCQKISAQLAKPHNAVAAFRLIKPLVRRPREMLNAVIVERRHLPPTLRVIGEVPNFEGRVPSWLVQVGHQFSAKIEEWLSQQVAQYLRNNAEEFRRIGAAHHDGFTLCIVMSRIPGIDVLRLAARGKPPKVLEGTAWLKGTPVFAVHAHAGYRIR